MTAKALIYTALWASAAIATQYGLKSAPPLILASTRFTLAGLLLLGARVVWRRPLFPPRKWWRTLFILGLLNTAIYLGGSFVALTVVPAGLFNLFVAVNPSLVLVFERFLLHRPVAIRQWLGLSVATFGLAVGAWQAIWSFGAPFWGVGLIALGQSAMAAASILFQSSRIDLHPITVNTWQLLSGSLVLWPLALATEWSLPVHWNSAWWGSLAWLTGAVSIGAMLLWFDLLGRGGAQRASFWLLLTPVIGYGLGFLMLGQPWTVSDMVATVLVVTGMIVGQAWRTPPHPSGTSSVLETSIPGHRSG